MTKQQQIDIAPSKKAASRVSLVNAASGKTKSVSFYVAAAESLQLCLTLCDPTDGSHQAPPSLGFSRQEHWSGLPFPSPMHESEK